MSAVVRVNDSYHSPRKPIPFNWGTSGTAWVGGGGGTNPFSTFATDPNTNAFPEAYMTGRAGIDGNFTVALKAGFTPPVTLTAWEWNPVANAWFKIGADAALYNTAYDATYALSSFKVSESAAILIQSSAAITGAAYTDGRIEASTIGASQEG